MIIFKVSKKAFIHAFILVSLIAHAEAQKVILSPHKKPLSWTITYEREMEEEKQGGDSKSSLGSYSAISNFGEPPLEKVKFIFTDPVSLRTAYYISKKEKSYYYFRGIEISEDPDHKTVGANGLDTLVSDGQLFREKFPKVSWVTPEYYVGKVEAYNQVCHYFKDGIAQKWVKGDNYHIDMTKFYMREAWFSVETGLPVAFRVGDEEGKYDFHDGEQAKVIVPAKIKEEINKYLRYLAYEKKRAEPAKPAPE